MSFPVRDRRTAGEGRRVTKDEFHHVTDDRTDTRAETEAVEGYVIDIACLRKSPFDEVEQRDALRCAD